MDTPPNAPQPSEAPPPAPVVKLGDLVLDRYRVVEQIASGGHSVVYRGQDERLSRPVCIKVFSGLARHSGVGRTSYEHFVQEAFALSRLTHPNTLRIYDFGHLGAEGSDGMPMQICEYMNGGTLTQLLRDHGPQPLPETVRVVDAMCLALAEAHGLGIVHRDIKPQNILFAAVGGARLPKLADFGIAKWSADDDNKQQRAQDTAIVAGQKLAMYSPSWAAPEQLAGQPVSPATDIYSLACVAIYMLSGKSIFADDDVYAGYRKRRTGGDLAADALASCNVPAAAIAVLGHALAFDPKQRLARVEDLAEQLAAAAAPPPEPVRATPAPPPEPAPIAPAGPLATPGATHAAPWGPGPRPWMAVAPVAQGAPRPLLLSDVPQVVGDRRVHFVHVPGCVADLVGGPSTQQCKIRVTVMLGPTGARVLHIKGLSCFVAPLGGRPSPAVQLDQSGDIALVTPRAQEIGHIRVATGTGGAGHTVYPVGGARVAIAADDCIDAILFDFGPGSDAYFVYTRGRAIPRSRRS